MYIYVYLPICPASSLRVGVLLFAYRPKAGRVDRGAGQLNNGMQREFGQACAPVRCAVAVDVTASL